MGVNALVVGLLVLGDHVESVADVDVHVLIFGRVVDVVFAGKENATLGVFLVDADVARGERNPEPGFFFIFEFVINHDGIFQRGAGILLVAIVVALAIDYEYFLDGNARTLEKTDLLGLFVFDGGLSA